MTKRVIPDYTNQLDLFSEAVPEPPPPTGNVPLHASGLSHARPRPQQLAFDVWEPLPPFDDQAVAAKKPAGAGAVENGGALHERPVQPAPETHDRISAGLATAARRDPSAERVVDIEPDEKPCRDFRISDAHRIGEGRLQEKAHDNIAAIRLLKTLEAESREATDDEKAMLARYVGWGGMPNVFGYSPPGEWRSTAAAVKELLTGAELESARASTPNAHFTSPQVIEAIWSGLQQVGLGKGAQILEPAMGVGHFFGLMPESMQGGHRTGVELDSITARIAKKLYPDATIFQKGFEETPLPDNYFDAVVGNVPFG